MGRDIVALKAEARWGSKFYKNLSKDLKEANPLATCFSPKNLLYMKNFYCMYLPYTEIGQQLANQLEKKDFSSQHRAKNSSFEINQQLADQLEKVTYTIKSFHPKGDILVYDNPSS